MGTAVAVGVKVGVGEAVGVGVLVGWGVGVLVGVVVGETAVLIAATAVGVIGGAVFVQPATSANAIMNTNSGCRTVCIRSF